MVTKREKIEYHGLKISVEPVEEKPFYLTGDSPSFRVVIENDTSNKQRGKIAVRWRLANVLTTRVVKFELDPFANEKYEIPREWLYREGTVIYELPVMPKPPEEYANVLDERVRQESARTSIHPLCSYYVRDKDLHKYEENYRKTIIGLTVVIIGLTIINLISFIYS